MKTSQMKVERCAEEADRNAEGLTRKDFLKASVNKERAELAVRLLG